MITKIIQMAKIANKSEGCLNILFFSRKKVTILLKKKVEEKFLNPEFSSVVFF